MVTFFSSSFLVRSASEYGLVGAEFLAVLAFELAGDIVTLDDDRGDLAGFHLGHEIAEVELFRGWPRLVEHVEKQDHHQADDQPEREILVKLVQGKPPSECCVCGVKNFVKLA